MRLFRFFLPLMALVAISCSHRSETYRQLVQVDSLLLGHNNVDSALSILNNIEPVTEEDSAYYNILKVSAAYQNENLDKYLSGIDASIKYYTDNYDTRKLAYAYYYKALIIIGTNNVLDEILLLLKKAEQQAEKISDYRLLDRVYSVLTFVNARYSEFDEAINYARKELVYAQKLNDNYCKAYALLNLAIIHHNLYPGSDSLDYYIQQCKSIADEVENNAKAFLHNYIGQTLIATDTLSAIQCFTDALKYDHLSETYLNLAKIYFNKKKYDIAQQYCDSALLHPSLLSRKGVYTLMAEYYYKNNDIEQYRNATEKIMEVQAELSQEKETRKWLELQNKFDYEKQHAEYQRKMTMLCMTIVFLIVVLVFIHRIRVRRAENKRMELELNYEKSKNALALMESRIATLQTDKKSSTTELTALKRKVETLRDTVRQNILKGRKMYDEICANASPLGWTDNDLLCLFDYISTQDPEFASRLDTDYDGLNNGQKLFVIVEQYLKKSDFEICQMFGLEKSSLYNKRNRIAKKKGNKNTI